MCARHGAQRLAVSAIKTHVTAGHRRVVDLDLEAFFDRVNHDLLMARIAHRVRDKRLLRLMQRVCEILKRGRGRNFRG